MMKRINKKAVSPLIATVLLIAFAVALGAIVMNWGRTYIDDTQDAARAGSEGLVTCEQANIELEIVKAFVEPNEDGEHKINLTLKNNGHIDIPKFAVQLLDEDAGQGALIEYDNKTFKSLNIKTYNFDMADANETEDGEGVMFTVNDEMKNVTRIDVIPFIDVTDADDPLPCRTRASKIDSDDEDEFIYVED